MMMRYFPVALALIGLMAVTALAVENKGAETISLNGGKRGLVTFPHHRHQNNLKECQLCHELFPQEKDAIQRLKSEGRLAKKQVMNKLCIKCHKAVDREGKPSGPKTCNKCHLKEK
jgi:hypothetical protein